MQNISNNIPYYTEQYIENSKTAQMQQLKFEKNFSIELVLKTFRCQKRITSLSAARSSRRLYGATSRTRKSSIA